MMVVIKYCKTRTCLTDFCSLSVLHWWQIKTNISGGTQHFREAGGHISSIYYTYIINTTPPTPLPVCNSLRLGDLGV